MYNVNYLCSFPDLLSMAFYPVALERGMERRALYLAKHPSRMYNNNNKPNVTENTDPTIHHTPYPCQHIKKKQIIIHCHRQLMRAVLLLLAMSRTEKGHAC